MGNLNRNTGKWLAMCGLSIFMLSVMHSSGAFAAQEKLTKVTFLCVTSRAPILDAGAFVAQSKGFYKEEGLDVSFGGGMSANDNVEMIGQNKGFAASTGVFSTMQARLKGVPVISVGVVTQSLSSCIVSLEGNPVRKPADLKGKTIAIPPASVNETTYKAFMKRQHLNRKEVVELMTTATAPLLIAKKVDCCTSAIYHTPVLVEVAGLTPVVLNFDDYGMDTYGVNIVVSDDSVKNNPELVRAFMRATVKGWEYALKHPREAEDIILKYNPTADPKYISKGLAGILPKIINKDTEKFGLFHQTDEKWNLALEILLDSGEIDKELDVKTCYTNDFLPKK